MLIARHVMPYHFDGARVLEREYQQKVSQIERFRRNYTAGGLLAVTGQRGMINTLSNQSRERQ